TQTKRHRPITANTYNDSTFQAVRRYLQFNKTQLIGITSMASNDGKTYCAINLAAAFANAGHKTLLIDTDFYRADISAIFNLQDTAGLINFLPDVSSVAVSPTSIENLYVIGVGQSFQQSRSVFLRSSFEQLLEKLRHEYAYIVVDTCPVGIISDYLHFSDHMDYSLFVVRDQLSEWKDILRLNKLLVSHKLKDKSAIIYNGVKTSEYYNGSVYYRKIAS
ncbi:MAG: CpsD/CapB family tyrosine-protein kinase, partial [Cytophagales bacterium]|nr:CpsD/CapB family tyrosine-protein kinase [Cytophagales bacterium]